MLCISILLGLNKWQWFGIVECHWSHRQSYCMSSTMSTKIRQPCSEHPQRQWSLLDHFCTVQSLRCLSEEMATSRLWPMWLRRAANNVSHCWFISAQIAGWWFAQAVLCRWLRCCIADQLWQLIEDAHKNNDNNTKMDECLWVYHLHM